MSRSDPPPSSLRSVRLWIVAAWTAIGLLETLKAAVSRELRDIPPLPLDQALINNLPWWYAWAALTPVALAVARRVRFDRGRWAAPLAIHAVAGLGLSALHLLAVGTLFYYTTTRGFAQFPAAADQVRFFIDGYLLMDLVTYGAIVGAWHAVSFHREARERELEAIQIREQAVRARLDALRMELNPHFLFNALNSVSGLVQDGEREGALRMLARIGDLLRITLELDEDMITLEEEVAIAARYLDIEAVRFRDRLSVDVRVDPAALPALVPPLLLQPLVENAIRHGIRRRPGAGSVTLSASVSEGRLLIEVADDGPGFGNGAAPDGRAAVGLQNVSERLRTCYGADTQLLIGGEGPGGTVRLDLPFRRARDPAPAPARPRAGGGRRAAGPELRAARAGGPPGGRPRR